MTSGGFQHGHHGVMDSFMFSTVLNQRHSDTNRLTKPPIVYVQPGVNRNVSTKVLCFILPVIILTIVNVKTKTFFTDFQHEMAVLV